jgi:23S rRNA pseudouridine2604 synthase
MENSNIRLNKYISESGVCSRREADRFIESGNVLINGKRAKIGDQVRYSDKVVVNGQLIEPRQKEDSVLIAFNKPVGVTSTTEITTRNNIVDYVNHSDRIFPVGRLDKDSQGLIFLTNNGDIVNKILRAGNKHEKEYIVTVNKPVTEDFVMAMSNGVPVLGETTKKCTVVKEAPFIFRIILIQGLNRQIRRMCEYFGYEVAKLERIRIMNITLKGVPLGEWRELTDQEKEGIYKAIEGSISTTEKKTSGKTSDKIRNKKDNRSVERRPEGKTLGKAKHNPDKRKRGKTAKSNNSRPGKGRPAANGKKGSRKK